MFEKINILIVEDNQSDVDLLVRELKNSDLNFAFEIVQNQESYERMIDTFKPDIILSDYNLPSFDGLTAFHIKQQKTPNIPFIIVSGTIGEENAVELIKSGVTDYALKDKLFVLASKIHRAVKDYEELKAKMLADEKLKKQNEKLFQIAFLQSHQVRVPVAQILGLFSIFNFEKINDPLNVEILVNLKLCAKSLDNTIREIVKITSEIRASQ